MTQLINLFEHPILGPSFIFIFGLIWGSFFNVCICRIPGGESLLWDRSRCPKCASLIPGWHNIPIFSYLLLRGRCSKCKSTISIQYPLVELSTGALFLMLHFHFGFGMKFFVYSIFVSSLLVISVIDLYHRIIPDVISLPGIVVGFAAALLTNDILWYESLLGIGLGGGIFWGIASLYEKFAGREGLGGGDVKLLAMLGAWLGYRSIIVIILISSALGSLVGIFYILKNGKDFKAAIPFGPFLAFAGALILFFRSQIFELIYHDMGVY